VDKVLLVDDEAVVLTLMGRVLQKAGVRTVLCTSGDDAMLALQDPAHEFVLVVTDVSMPGSLDGIGLAAEIWRLRPGLPVVVVSGSVESLGRARENEVVRAVLAKPIHPDELVGIARDLVPQAFGAGDADTVPAS
jgi:CheY-like chemotaxis protein